MIPIAHVRYIKRFGQLVELALYKLCYVMLCFVLKFYHCFSPLHIVYQLQEGNEAQRKPNQICKNDQKALESC